MSGFTCHILPPDQARLVYPLVREAVPTLGLKAWLSFAKQVSNPRRWTHEGIMVVQRLPRPLPCGLFIYRREQDLAHGPILVAEHLVAVDVLDPEPVLRALLSELDALAARLECTAIRTMVLGQSSFVESGLHAAGHRRQGTTLWKPLENGSNRAGTLDG